MDASATATLFLKKIQEKIQNFQKERRIFMNHAWVIEDAFDRWCRISLLWFEKVAGFFLEKVKRLKARKYLKFPTHTEHYGLEKTEKK